MSRITLGLEVINKCLTCVFPSKVIFFQYNVIRDHWLFRIYDRRTAFLSIEEGSDSMPIKKLLTMASSRSFTAIHLRFKIVNESILPLLLTRSNALPSLSLTSICTHIHTHLLMHTLRPMYIYAYSLKKNLVHIKIKQEIYKIMSDLKFHKAWSISPKTSSGK